MATVRCGKLRHILRSPDLGIKLKLRLYEAAVLSILVYGCESWLLDKKAMKILNGANSTMLSSFTGKTIRQEATPSSTSLNLIYKLRVRRHKWLGHIIRAGPDRLIYQAVEHQNYLKLKGRLSMDAPPHTNLRQLAPLAADRATWQELQLDIPTNHFL